PLASHFFCILFFSKTQIHQCFQKDTKMCFIPGGQIHTFAESFVEKRVAAVTVHQFFETSSMTGIFEHVLLVQRCETFIFPLHNLPPPIKRTDSSFNENYNRWE